MSQILDPDPSSCLSLPPSMSLPSLVLNCLKDLPLERSCLQNITTPIRSGSDVARSRMQRSSSQHQLPLGPSWFPLPLPPLLSSPFLSHATQSILNRLTVAALVHPLLTLSVRMLTDPTLASQNWFDISALPCSPPTGSLRIGPLSPLRGSRSSTPD
jgi:hypothetical protein